MLTESAGRATAPKCVLLWDWFSREYWTELIGGFDNALNPTSFTISVPYRSLHGDDVVIALAVPPGIRADSELP